MNKSHANASLAVKSRNIGGVPILLLKTAAQKNRNTPQFTEWEKKEHVILESKWKVQEPDGGSLCVRAA